MNPVPVTPSASQQATRNALVVDDIPSVRFYHSYILKQAGFSCEVASNGEEALQKLGNKPWDLAVVDIMMPKLNGLELIRRIRETAGYARLPILVISSEPVSDEISVVSGPIGFVKKPLSPGPVIQEVTRLMSSR